MGTTAVTGYEVKITEEIESRFDWELRFVGIRIDIGALKSTPVQLLETEADIKPLKFRRENPAIA